MEHSRSYYWLNKYMIILFGLPPAKFWRIYSFREIRVKQTSLTPLLWYQSLWLHFGRKVVPSNISLIHRHFPGPLAGRQDYVNSSGQLNGSGNYVLSLLIWDSERFMHDFAKFHGWGGCQLQIAEPRDNAMPISQGLWM